MKLNSESSFSGATTLYYLQAVCDQVGTGQEGWYLNGSLISLDTCSNKVISCENHGTPQEGWYTYTKTSSYFVLYASTESCLKSTDIYQCTNGIWYKNQEFKTHMLTASCATDVLSCELDNGQYLLKINAPSNRTLIQNTNCSSKLLIYE